MLKSPYFLPEHINFRSELRQFFNENVVPFIDEWESKKRIPREVWIKMGEAGLLGLHHPGDYGGKGLDFFYSVVFLEELGRIGYAGGGVCPFFYGNGIFS